MSARWLAFVVVLALLPTAELVEQGVHVAEHALHGDPPDHDAHHEEHDPADEHGCTQLVHLCGQSGLGLMPTLPAPVLGRDQVGTAAPVAPRDLHDLAASEPAHRPPIS